MDNLEERIDEMIEALQDTISNLHTYARTGNKSAGRRARKLLDKLSHDKVALRKAMLENDKAR
jgi:recombinational DNA repair protein RecR